jgi:predicted PhzF superfamily epimerase YddE/YHI9
VSTLHVLKVFVGESGEHGNPLGVFLRGEEISPDQRQVVAADLGFAETVFVDDAQDGSLRIFTPGTELPFAGHPLVGTAWLLRREGHDLTSLRPPAGEVPVRHDGELTFVAGRPEWAPDFEIVETGSPEEVEALEGPPEGLDLVGVWAWQDEGAGRVRARVFLPRIGVEEDEATGAHAVRLADKLGRGIEIHQGAGSIIFAEPLPDGSVEIGGHVEHMETRDYEGAE